MDIDKMLTAEETAVWLRMKLRDLRKKARTGVIPAFRVGERQMRFHPRTVIAKLAADTGVDRAVIEASLSVSPQPARRPRAVKITFDHVVTLIVG